MGVSSARANETKFIVTANLYQQILGKYKGAQPIQLADSFGCNVLSPSAMQWNCP